MELNGLTEGQIKFLADRKGISVEEYKLNSSTEGEPGKTNDLAQTANAGSETMTAGGESISADTSLEQSESNLSPLEKARKALDEISFTDQDRQDIIDQSNAEPEKNYGGGVSYSTTGLSLGTTTGRDKYPYDAYIKEAKAISGEDGNWVQTAKDLYVKAESAALLDKRSEKILEDLDNDSYTALGRLRKYAGKLARAGQVAALLVIPEMALDTQEGELERDKIELTGYYENKNKETMAAYDASVVNIAKQVSVIELSDRRLDELNNLKEENPAALTQDNITEYNNLVATRNAAYTNYSKDIDGLSDLETEAATASQIATNTLRTYDNLDVFTNRVSSTTMNLGAGLLTVAAELQPDQIIGRITGDYEPLWLGSGLKAKAFNFAADKLYEGAQKITEGTKKHQEFGQIDSLEDALEYGLDLFSEQAVNTAVTAGIPGLGLVLVSASAAGQKMHEMNIEIGEGEKISPIQFYSTAIMYGLGEYVTETVSLGQFKLAQKNLSKAFAKKGSKGFGKQAFDSASKSFDLADTGLTNKSPSVFRAMETWGINTLKEGSAEGTAQVLNNAADKWILGKDISMTDGVSDAFFAGAIMSGIGFNAPALVVDFNRAMSSGADIKAATARSKKIVELTNSITRLQSNNQLKNDDQTLSAIAAMQKEADELAMENLAQMKINQNRLDDLSRADKSKLLDVDSDTYRLKAEIDRINENPKISEADKASMILRKAQEIDALNNVKEGVLANSQYSKERQNANAFQRKVVAIEDLDYKIVEGENPDDAVAQAKDLINKSNLSDEAKQQLLDRLDEEYTSDSGKDYINGFEFGAEQGFPIIVGVKNVALRELSQVGRTVFRHETSHATFFKKLLAGDADILGLAADLETYMLNNFKGAAEVIAGVNKRYANGNMKMATIAEEKMVALLEYGSRTNVEMDRTMQGKMMSMWNSIRSPKQVTSIKTGKDVWDALKAFNTSFDTGEISGLTEDILTGKVKARQSAAKEKLKEIRKNPDTNFSLDNPSEFNAPNKSDLFSVTTNVFNEATESYGLDIKLNEDGTPNFTKAQWDAVDENTKLVIGFMLGDTWKPYVNYLMGSRRDVPGFDEYASQIVDRTSTGIEKGDDGIPFLVKTYNPEGGAKLSSYVFGQVGRRLQGAINKQDGFGEITVEAVSDKPGAKELVQEETTTAVEETPKYKNLVRRGIVNPITVGNIKSKIKTIIRVLKTPMNAPVSNNVTVKPWVNELRLQLGKQVDLIIKQEMGGVKGGELRRFLLKNKTAILENMTTSYLTKAMPFAVQKSVSGVYTSNWQGQKIDRETTDTQKAGRTSGNELVRRLPKASIRISDAEFLAAIIGPGGNPIRGRKEALAKAIAEELSLDIISQELQNPESDIAQAFAQNQEMLGVAISENTANEARRDFERGSIKFSKEINEDLILRSDSSIDKRIAAGKDSKYTILGLKHLSARNKTNELLDNYNLKSMPDLGDVKNWDQNQKDFVEALKKDVFPLAPKEFFFGKDGGGIFTASASNLGSNVKSDSPAKIGWAAKIEAIIADKSIKYGKPIPGISNFTVSSYTTLMKDEATFLKNKKEILAHNKKVARIHKVIWGRLATKIRNKKSSAVSIAKFLHFSVNAGNHFHRNGAQIAGYSKGFKAGGNEVTFEHAMTNQAAYLYLIDAALLSREKNPYNFRAAYKAVSSNYYVVALNKSDDAKLTGDFKSGMGPNWNLRDNVWWERYSNAGIDMSTIMMLNGKSIAEIEASPEQSMFSKSLKPDAVKVQSELIEKDVASNNELATIVFSKEADLNSEFNEMIERDKGVSATKEFSKVQAELRGKKIGKYKFFAPGADDFRGLTSYTFAGKGKQGEADQKFIEDNLVKPYQRGINAINVAKQTIKKDFTEVAKIFKPQAQQLKKNLPNSKFTYDQALRVYLWNRQGMEVPGMDKDDLALLNKAIADNPKLIEFANAILMVSKQGEWMKPSDYWLTETVLSDLNNMSEKIGRKTYLAEFIAASDIVFSPENLNKIEALYGTVHREAIEDALYSMKNGTNRPSGSNKTVNRWNNWLNQSTGAIMFFNRRSAVLQLLSTANFINWSDNNPIKAAAAFANQKQFWTDFAMIFNSAKLKQRRSGLKNDVNTAELANAVEGSKNKAASALNYLLTIGFTPTQIADSFAIASGGASFYRNRVNTYLKQGKSQKEAETLAFEEFSSTADESQQSSDPMLVSQQQRSILGRIVLAFQNTPMQYTRLMKKAGQDLINGRGDAKTNISKIIYYGAVQNLIFSTLQSALFAFIPGFGDDDEDPEKRQTRLDGKETRVINSMVDSLLKGSGLTGAVIATVKNTIMEYIKQEEKGFMGRHAYTIIQALGISPPIGSKVRKLYTASTAKNFNKDAMGRGADVMADGRLNLSPWYSIFGNLASATINLPLDRVVDEVTSISEALDSRNTMWQRIALGMGWKTWDVGAKNEYHDLLKTQGKASRKAKGKEKAKETRANNNNSSSSGSSDAAARRRERNKNN